MLVHQLNLIRADLAFTAEERLVLSPSASRGPPSGGRDPYRLWCCAISAAVSGRTAPNWSARQACQLLKVDWLRGRLLHRPSRADDAVPPQEEQVVHAERGSTARPFWGSLARLGQSYRGTGWAKCSHQAMCAGRSGRPATVPAMG